MTAVTISSDVDELHLDGSTRYQDGTIWGLEGMDGWDGTPAPRESPTPRPQADGGYMPSRLTVDSRVITLRAFVKCRSSIQATSVRDRVCDLMARTLTVTVEDTSGARQCTGYLSADPATTVIWWGQAVRCSLIITCPDPLKYGPAQVFPGKNGTLQLVNNGRLPVWPIITVAGHVTRLALSGPDGCRITWQGDSRGLTLDCRDMIPSAGRIAVDEVMPVPVGGSLMAYETDEGAQVSASLRPAWR